MPRKATRMNRSYGRLKKPTKKRASASRARVLTVARPMRAHDIIKPKQIINVATSFVGYNNSTTTPAFSIYANSLYQPFNTASPITTTGLITATSASSITQNPIGYQSMSTLYNYYRVLRSKITVYLMPTASKNWNVTVYPSAFSAGTGVGTFNVNSCQRYAKWKTMNPYGDHRGNEIVNSIASHEFLGMTLEQFIDQPPIAFGSAPTGVTDWFWIIDPDLQGSGTIVSGDFSIVIQLDLTVELSDPVTQTA